MLSCGALSGCASVEPLPPSRETFTQIQVEPVPVPVPVACVALSDIPQRPKMPPTDHANANIHQLAAAVVAHMLGLEAYADRAELVMMMCASLAPKPAPQ